MHGTGHADVRLVLQVSGNATDAVPSERLRAIERTHMSSESLMTFPLKNGLTLRCLDKCKKIAADRWYICIFVEIGVPVKEEWFKDSPLEAGMFERIKNKLGNEVVFRQKKERNFVGDDQKDQIVESICEGVVEMGERYLGNDSFAAKFILKEFANRPYLQKTK
jgi:hypothetical protein